MSFSTRSHELKTEEIHLNTVDIVTYFQLKAAKSILTNVLLAHGKTHLDLGLSVGNYVDLRLALESLSQAIDQIKDARSER